jgi:adenylyl- and sulfurtransferase ThiI
MDKTEIVAMARRIGTYGPSIKDSYACPFLPDRPLTQGSVAKLRELLDQIEGTTPELPASEMRNDGKWGSNE